RSRSRPSARRRIRRESAGPRNLGHRLVDAVERGEAERVGRAPVGSDQEDRRMTLSRGEKNAARPVGRPVASAWTGNTLPGRRVLAWLREIRGEGWAAILERIAPGWSWRAAFGGDRSRGPRRTFQPTIDGRLEARVVLSKYHVIPKVLANANF